MDIRLLKKFCLMMVCILTTVGTASCSSDDEPMPPTISDLDQKLLKGIWISGDLEKGNLFTMEFKEGNIVTINVIHNNTEYYRQLESSYKVNGNNIFIMGSRTGAKTLIVKSMSDNEMVVEAINLTNSGETVTNTFVRRNPTTADKLENTTWTVKTSVPWIEANKDELTLPGNLLMNGKRTLSLKNLPNTFKQMMSDEYWHIVFYDDSTMAQVTCYDDKVQVWSYPYTLENYKMSCSAMMGSYEGSISYTVFKTEEGDLFFIYGKDAVMGYIIDYCTMLADLQGCDITRAEWEAFANDFDESLNKAQLYLIFEPDNGGREYMKEALTYGTWVHQDESLTDKICFDKNGKITNTFTNDGESGQVVYDYSVIGNKLTLVNPNGVEMTIRINLFGDQMIVVFSDYTILYDRK